MMRKATPESWRRFLADRGLSERSASLWSAWARPNIHIEAGALQDLDTTVSGASKFGGLPDLPVGMPWPMRAGYAYPPKRGFVPDSAMGPQPLAFLAQINLADVARRGSDLPLPGSGWLAFFYDVEVQPSGFDPCDGPGTRVLYVTGGAQVRRQAPPDGRLCKVRPLRLSAGECLPDWNWILDLLEDKSDPHVTQFLKDVEKLKDEDRDLMSRSGHSFGGWAEPIQSSMELKCQLVANGLYMGGPDGYADPRVAELRPGAKDWRLLLQLDYDEELNWIWGDGGRLYFWCREQDIAQGRFERVWTILQCH
jgi:uncharacterized protein YwqG